MKIHFFVLLLLLCCIFHLSLQETRPVTRRFRSRNRMIRNRIMNRRAPDYKLAFMSPCHSGTHVIYLRLMSYFNIDRMLDIRCRAGRTIKPIDFQCTACVGNVCDHANAKTFNIRGSTCPYYSNDLGLEPELPPLGQEQVPTQLTRGLFSFGVSRINPLTRIFCRLYERNLSDETDRSKVYTFTLPSKYIPLRRKREIIIRNQDGGIRVRVGSYCVTSVASHPPDSFGANNAQFSGQLAPPLELYQGAIAPVHSSNR